MGDLIIGSIVGIVSIYLLWQQNQIFRQQNEIFAAQAGTKRSKMLSETPIITRLKSYWPMMVMTSLMMLTWGTIGYDYYDRHHSISIEQYMTQWGTIVGRPLDYVQITADGHLLRSRIADYDRYKIAGVCYHYEGLGDVQDVQDLQKSE